MEKKRLFLLLLFCTFCIIGGLIRSKSESKLVYSGEIGDRQWSEEGSLFSFIMRTNTGEPVGILVDDTTHIWFLPGMGPEEDFREKESGRVTVSVTCKGRAQTLTLADGEKVTAYRAEDVMVLDFQTEDTVTLADGMELSLWKGNTYNAYKLEDGTELVREMCVSGPDNAYVTNQESFDDLSETAKQNVLAYYEKQGKLYDLADILEKAYASYLKRDELAGFDFFRVEQSISPSASNEHMMYFVTTVYLPIAENLLTEIQLGAAFDRETGVYSDGWELFSCPKEEVIQTVLDLGGITDPVLRNEMEAAFRPEYILVFPEHLTISFPQGTLPSQEYSYGFGVDYDDRLCRILYDWVVPVQ